ncbi:DNA glycosylase [Bisporella sp. PMI_857]|nr:DNA glycosylase [Bisporella sp. PMI_857]
MTESGVAQGKGEFEAEVKERTRRSKRSKAPVVSPFFTPASTPTKLAKFSRIDPSPTTDEAEFVTPKSTIGNPQTTGGTVSCIPFPPLGSPTFGLIQERLANNPFRLLIAVTFLIKTRGKDAIPVYFELMNKYPTPEALATASKEDIVPIIHHLGLQNQRAGTYQTYGKIWIENPPVKDKRYPVRGYPNPDSGRDIKRDEILDDADERDAWEIGHMTQGSYSLDSWRIFCRDKLRGVARSWNGEGTESGFQPEWMRVLPEDKELRAFLRWMWLKEGFDWDPLTGEKEVAGPDLMRAAIEGKISWDERSGIRIMDSEVKDAPTVIAAEQQ